MGVHVLHYSLPRTRVVSDLMAVRANRQDCPKGSNFLLRGGARANLASEIPPPPPGVNRRGEEQDNAKAEEFIGLPAFVVPGP